MAKKTINELDDGELIRTSNAVVAFEESGVTKKCSIRPNPPNTHYVQNQAQLEVALGTDLIIPDNTHVTIVVDESFTLTKHFRLNNGSSLEIISTKQLTVITYTGVEAMFTDISTTKIFGLKLENIDITGTGIPTLFNIKSGNIVIVNDCEFVMDNLGTISNVTLCVSFNLTKFLLFDSGLVISDCPFVFVDKSLVEAITNNKATFLSVSAQNTPSLCYINKVNGIFFFADTNLLFLDPNSIAGTKYTIEKSSIDDGTFYKTGSDFVISTVLNAAGHPRFRTTITHNYSIGDIVSLSGFTEPSYNLTGVVTATPTGVEFMVDNLDFVADDAGVVTGKSLDQESFIVTAADNPNQSNSLSITEARGLHTGVRSGLTVTINGGDNTQFDVAAGEAIIVNYDDPLNPTFQRILFAGQTAIPGAPASHVTFIYLNSGGTLDVTEDIPTKADVKGRPFVGQLIQSEATGEIFFSLQNPIVAHATSQTEINSLVLANGAQRVSGCEITPASTDLSIDIAAGEVKQYGRNFGTDAGNPNFKTTPATIPVPANLLFKALTNESDGLIRILPGVLTDQLDPTMYHAGGTGDALSSVSPSNRFTVIRVFLSANSNALIPYYGTALYTSAQEALSAAEPTWKESPETFSTSPIAKIAISGDVTDLAAAVAGGTTAIIMQISERIQL